MGTSVDLSSPTEVDPNSHLSLSGTDVTISGLARNEDAYIYKEIDPLTGDYTYKFDWVWTTQNSNSIMSQGFTDGIVDDVSGWDFANSLAEYVWFRSSGGSTGAVIHVNMYAGGKSQGDIAATLLTVGTRYYITIQRVGLTTTVYIYTDSGRTTLHDSGSLTADSAGDLVSCDTCYLVSSHNTNPAHTFAITAGDVLNHDLTDDVIKAAPSSLTSDAVISTVTVQEDAAAYPSAVTSVSGILTPDIFTPIDILVSSGVIRPVTINAAFATPAALVSTSLLSAPTTFAILVVTPPTLVSSQSVIPLAEALGRKLLIGVTNFPSGATVLYKIESETPENVYTTVRDWTSTNVHESPASGGKSAYSVETDKMSGDGQYIVMWKTDDEAYNAQEIVNIHSTYLIDVKSRVLALSYIDKYTRQMWKLHGLDIGNVLTVTETRRYTDDGEIDQDIDTPQAGVTQVTS